MDARVERRADMVVEEREISLCRHTKLLKTYAMSAFDWVVVKRRTRFDGRSGVRSPTLWCMSTAAAPAPSRPRLGRLSSSRHRDSFRHPDHVTRRCILSSVRAKHHQGTDVDPVRRTTVPAFTTLRHHTTHRGSARELLAITHQGPKQAQLAQILELGRDNVSGASRG